MKALLDGLRALGPARLAMMGAVGLGMLGLIALLALHGGSGQNMALLYGDLDIREAGQISDALDKAHIQHELGGEDDRILVPADQVAAARLLLAKSGLPSGGSIGYEIFDRGDSLTATQFEQTINETRAMEGELARSIRLIDGVRNARVHLVLPHREPFASEQQPAQASILLTMVGARRLDPEGVQAVLNLVGAAVPGLKPQNIAIIDSRGDVLARAGQPTGALGTALTVDDLRQATELRLSREVEAMLEPTVGADRVRAEAAVTMDQGQVRETQESFNPDQQVLRSQQTTSDKSKNSEAQQTTSVQNNLPNAAASQPQTGSQEEKQEEVSNYEIGKTVRTTVQDQPRISRISIAVMVDGTVMRDPGGKPVWKARSQKELDDIATLVKSAIGYDAKRGDTVSVVSMPFSLPAPDDTPVAAGGMIGHFAHADLMHIAQSAILGLIVLLALLFVVRPMVMRLTAARAPGGAAAMGSASLSLPGAPGAIAGAAGTPGSGVALLAAPADPNQSAEDGMISVANIEGRMRASSLRQLVDTVSRHPEESLSIVRSWLGHEQEAG